MNSTAYGEISNVILMLNQKNEFDMERTYSDFKEAVYHAFGYVMMAKTFKDFVDERNTQGITSVMDEKTGSVFSL
jgi:hypothetical protein